MLLTSVVSGGLVAAYLGLFAFRRRPVALRVHRLGYLLALAIVCRGSATVFGRETPTQPEVVALVAGLGVSAVLMSATRIWIARQGGMTFRNEILRACPRLVLPVEERQRGCLMLTTRARTSYVRWFEGGKHILVVILPRRQGRDKITLLLDWLEKQYAGPIPRVPITP